MAHECPACHMPCHCDCDDTYFDDPKTLAACRHPNSPDCHEYWEYEDYDDLFDPDLDDDFA